MATLIPNELDELIREYLTDGVISARERQVLLKKAASMGLDTDEIDLYIDAQEQKVQQHRTEKIEHRQGMKCPYCGARLPHLSDKCPECGHFVTPDTSTEISEIIETLENALIDMKSGRDFAASKANVEKNLRKAELYYSNNPKIKILIEKINEEVAAASKQKKINDLKGFLSRHWLPIAFAVIVLIELLFFLHYYNLSNAYELDYYNHSGNRMALFAQQESASSAAQISGGIMALTIFMGVAVAIHRHNNN